MSNPPKRQFLLRKLSFLFVLLSFFLISNWRFQRKYNKEKIIEKKGIFALQNFHFKLKCNEFYAIIKKNKENKNMSYFVLENNNLICVDEPLSMQLEELYQKIRRMYVIEFSCSDWAEDTGDSGMGYDYNNSYEIFREPQRREMVIEDGKLAGFYVGFSDDIRLENNPSKEYFLKLEDNANIHRGSSTNRYGNSKSWTLHINETPSPMMYVCLLRVENEDKEYNFSPSDFDCEFVESVANKCKWEDNYGKFDGTFRVTLKLTDKGAQNPDEVLKALNKYRPVIVNQ